MENKYLPLKIIFLLSIYAYSSQCIFAKNENFCRHSSSRFNYSDTIQWSDKFTEFKFAVMNADTQKVKSFFKFPIQALHNEIWFLTDLQENTDKNIPFTEKDFDKYYNNIFSKEFAKGISLVEVENLIQFGEFQTQVYLIDDEFYQINCYFEANKNQFNIILNSSEYEDMNEDFSIIFIFDISSDKNLTFNKVSFAG